MDIGDSKLKCLPARERQCFCQKTEIQWKPILTFLLHFDFGNYFKKIETFCNQKSFNFCIFLFIFPFYLTDNIVEKHIVLMCSFYTMSNKDKTFCSEWKRKEQKDFTNRKELETIADKTWAKITMTYLKSGSKPPESSSASESLFDKFWIRFGSSHSNFTDWNLSKSNLDICGLIDLFQCP